MDFPGVKPLSTRLAYAFGSVERMRMFRRRDSHRSGCHRPFTTALRRATTTRLRSLAGGPTTSLHVACAVLCIEEENMKWSWKIGRVAGIDVFMHATFVLLLAWIGASALLRGQGWSAALVTVLFVVALFSTVVLHEFGHALTARRFGIQTRDITLLPIGGVARLERMPENPRHELLVALAGPAVNVAIAAILFAGLYAMFGAIPPPSTIIDSDSFVTNLAWVNVTLAVFNLIPAFPMDGGRALRAMLALKTSYVRATRAAARLGQALALLFGIVGLFANPILVFIALFVWMGASAEATSVELKASLEGLPVSSAMVTSFSLVSPHQPISDAIELAVSGFQQDFPVLDQGRLVGVLTHANLLEAVSRHGGGVPVGGVMEQEFKTAEPSEMLWDVLARLEECKCRTLPVTTHGQLVGLITMHNIGEIVAARGAFAQAGSATHSNPELTPWWETRTPEQDHRHHATPLQLRK